MVEKNLTKNTVRFGAGVATVLVTGALAALLSACGFNGGGQSGGLFDASVPGDHREAINGDLTMLAGSSFDSYAASIRNDATQVIGTSDLNGGTLARWFYERVRVILGAGFNWEANSYAVSAIQELDEPRTNATVTVMFNLGSHLYLKSVNEGRYYGLQTDNGFITATTPRVGLVQIGEGMFTDNQINGSSRESQANRFLRLAVMFHEARHSDGNGSDAGFPHAKCTSGSYNGRYACEGYSNGPYAVQAYTAAVFAMSCTQCTQSEYQTLLAFVGDYASRLQPDARYADPSPVY